ncbi:MAG: nucleotidyl transferase AbiEii/AbiGii toxin family protein [Planctomycetota bacterium]|nr:nucleotidyl transferase AbiEii/AbiGii toxin family protein [Planctomycetota bacterium]
MVKGLNLFRAHFSSFSDRYVLIGGTACDLAMGEAGLPFRGTKDLDIVLCVEALDAEFAKAFWAFVAAGGYEVQETATGQKRFYRFKKPANADYPVMLELFSRVPDALTVAEGSHLTPIPVDEEISSLSAILLDKDYYGWIHSGRRVVEGVPIVGPEHLIPLKAKAWLDLRARKEAGQEVDGGSIKKHKNDVFRRHCSSSTGATSRGARNTARFRGSCRISRSFGPPPLFGHVSADLPG